MFKRGAGTLTLTGANSYTGLTTLSVGTLTVGNNSGLGTTAGDTTVSTGAALRLANGVTVTGETILIAGTGIGFNGALQADASATAEWAGTVKINSADARVGAGSGGSLKISGAIVDNAGFNTLNVGARNRWHRRSHHFRRVRHEYLYRQHHHHTWVLEIGSRQHPAHKHDA